jgi:signal transduction histidine kinase
VNPFRDPDLARRLGLGLAAVSISAVLAGTVLFVASGARFSDTWIPHNLIGGLTLAVVFAAMVRKQPHNGAVWTLGWSMFLQSVGQMLLIGVNAFGAARIVGRDVIRTQVPYATTDLPTWLVLTHLADAVVWIPAIVPLVTFGLLLFPNGRLPSRRWRVVALLAALGVALTSIGFATAAPTASFVSGGVVEAGELGALALGGGVAVLAAILGSIASLVVRYRRSAGAERQQIRWIAAGGGVFGLSMFVWLAVAVDPELAQRLFYPTSLVTFPMFLASYGIAIVRYRLYEIDLVISRSVVVGTLAAFIAVVYVAVVVGVGRVIGAGEDSRLGLQVAATALVAVAFQPLRERVRRQADRWVLGRRATPYEVLSRFSTHVTEIGDDSSLPRIASLLAAGTGAVPAVVWLRVGDRIQPAASSDESTTNEPRSLQDGDLPDLDASLTVAVRHDGELLGAITLTKPRNDPVTPQDEELVARLAGGLALVLRNARLTAELRVRLVDLEASRQRIVHAQDDARRKIERDLRFGAQHQLTEVQALLEDARVHAADAGAQRTADLLGQLEVEAGDAVATLRDFGRGIYPPVLESQGLGPALAEQVRGSVLPVTVHAAGIGRYDRDVEAAVYFGVLEALQNATRYAEATSVHVGLEHADGALRFEVIDDGVGFDALAHGPGTGLRGIADRLDTVGGQVEIRSTPGAGTRIIGRVPLPHAASIAHQEVGS